MLIRFVRWVHKVLGLALSILFLMWFASGIVMIYHGFPRANDKLLLAKQEALPSGGLPSLGQLEACLPDSSRMAGLSVEMFLERPVFRLQGKRVPGVLYADSLEVAGVPDFPLIERLARQLGGAVAYRVDTLYKLDQWIPFGRLKRELPIYKFTFDDGKGQQLYVSSRTGKVLQLTDRASRAWAWVGAIPHWVYFKSLRQHQQAWTDFVVWASGLGAIMCATGLWVGVWAYWRNRRRGFRSPYRKRWYRWHHVSGMVFGVFALTFVFSGMMSMMDLPDWMKRGKREEQPKVRFAGRGGRMLEADAYRLDYRRIAAGKEEVKRIEWASFGGHPYYAVTAADGRSYIDASGSCALVPFRLTEAMVREAVEAVHGRQADYTLEWMTEYDGDYYSRRGMLTLPVYKVVVADELHTHHYFNPQTLYHRQVDDNGRLRGVLYRGLHSLNFRVLTDRPVLWNVVMYVLLIGGTFLSLTGVVLTFGWLKRVLRRLKRKY